MLFNKFNFVIIFISFTFFYEAKFLESDDSENLNRKIEQVIKESEKTLNKTEDSSVEFNKKVLIEIDNQLKFWEGMKKAAEFRAVGKYFIRDKVNLQMKSERKINRLYYALGHLLRKCEEAEEYAGIKDMILFVRGRQEFYEIVLVSYFNESELFETMTKMNYNITKEELKKLEFHKKKWLYILFCVPEDRHPSLKLLRDKLDRDVTKYFKYANDADIVFKFMSSSILGHSLFFKYFTMDNIKHHLNSLPGDIKYWADILLSCEIEIKI